MSTQAIERPASERQDEAATTNDGWIGRRCGENFLALAMDASLIPGSHWIRRYRCYLRILDCKVSKHQCKQAVSKSTGLLALTNAAHSWHNISLSGNHGYTSRS